MFTKKLLKLVLFIIYNILIYNKNICKNILQYIVTIYIQLEDLKVFKKIILLI